MNKEKTAILIFSNSAEKQVYSKSTTSIEVFDVLTKRTLREVEKTGFPYFFIPESEQIGNTFGKRFKNAIQAIYDKGFNNVISIGTDIPHLTSAHILKAHSQLKTNDFVLGPSKDGGFYLMGFKKSLFHKLTFHDLAWETVSLQRDFKSRLSQLSASVWYLEPLSDLDSNSDISLILETFKPLTHSLKKLLLKIQNASQSITDVILFQIELIFFNLNFNKGSPILLQLK